MLAESLRDNARDCPRLSQAVPGQREGGSNDTLLSWRTNRLDRFRRLHGPKPLFCKDLTA